MAAKSKSSGSEKQLKATVKGLTAKLERAREKTARSKKDKKQLQATVRSLTAKLERSEAKTARWKKQAERHEATAAASQARAAKLDKKLTAARHAANQSALTGRSELADTVTAQEAVPTDEPPALNEVELAPTVEEGAPETASSIEAARPDASWTVARLREETKSRGLTGLSGKSKAQLIAALT